MQQFVRHIILLFATLTATTTFAASSPVELPDSSWRVDVSNIRQKIISSARNRAEGIWKSVTDGITVAIIAGKVHGGLSTSDDTYLIVLLTSPRPRLQPGSVIGAIAPSAKPNNYYCSLFTKATHNTFKSPKKFTLELVDNSHLIIKKPSGGLKLSFSLTLPLLKFLRLRNSRESTEDIDGFIRVWPDNVTGPPAQPRKL